MNEEPLLLDCAGDRVLGIYHPGNADADTAVVIVVGGPQYRVGSHRQFVLMARSVSDAGFPVLRFDYRGMGDSEGDPRSFEDVDADIRNAVDRIVEMSDTIRKVVLVGLCDAASASLMYAANDERVVAQVLLNPWVRSEQGQAKSYLRHYYLQRLMQRSFWTKLFSGRMHVFKSVREFLQSVRQARGSAVEESGVDVQRTNDDFVSRMLRGLKSFTGPILFLISGRDLTAGEFVDLCKDDKAWKSSMQKGRVETQRLEAADHTYSRRESLDAANTIIIDWLHRLAASKNFT